MGFENGKLLRVVLSAVGPGGRDAATVLHYDLDDSALTGEDNDPQSLANTFRDDVVPTYAALFGSAWSIQPVMIEQERDPLHPTNPRGAWSAGAPVAGTRSLGSDVLPPGLCGICTLITAHIGRRFRGRIFLPGSIVEGDQNDGVVGSSMTGPWSTFVAAIPRQPDIATGTSDSTAKWCVYSRTQRTANLDPYASPVTATVVKTKLHYLRSRAV